MEVGISLFFPYIKKFDLVHKNHSTHSSSDVVVPWCKSMLGLHVENSNIDASFVESVKEKMMDYG